MMDEKRFQDLADAWGGDISRWPEAERPAAQDFAKAHPDLATTMLAEAAALDAVLAPAGMTGGSDLLERRILKHAPRPAFDADWRRPAVAAAAALVVGLAGGFAGGIFVPGQDETAYVSEYADAFDGLMEDWSAWEWSDA